MWQVQDLKLMVTLPLDLLSMSTPSVKTKLVVRMLICAFGLLYAIITTRSIQLALYKVPDFRVYTSIMLLSFSIQIPRGLIDSDTLQGSFLGFAGSAFSD